MKDSATLLQIINACQELRDRSTYTPYQTEGMETAIRELFLLRIKALNDEKIATERRRVAQALAMAR